jgi:hypothetical protein
MGVLLDRDISGAGTDSLAGLNVWYAVHHFFTLGLEVRDLDGTVDDYFLRAGWVSFGDSLSVIGGVALDYWRTPVHLNFHEQLITPIPTDDGSSVFVMRASRIRWFLSPGCTGHIYVYGT